MKIMRRTALVSTLGFLLLLSGCGGQGGTVSEDGYNQITIVAGNYYNQSTNQGKAFDAFADYVEEHSNGAVQVEVYHNSDLGNEADMTQAQFEGSVDIMFTATSGIGLYVPEICVYETFFAFAGIDEAKAAIASVREELDATLESKGFKLMGFYCEGPRYIYSQEPIDSIDDMQDLKFRAPASTIYVDCINALGANAICIALGDAYTSLQTGVVTAIEGPLELMISNKYYEQCKYVTESRHAYQQLWITYNLDNWNSLNEKTQQLLRDAIAYSEKYQEELWEQAGKDNRAYLEGIGCTFVELTDQEKWQEVCDEAGAEYAASLGELGEVIWDSILAFR